MDGNPCPWCGDSIPASGINLAEGVGLCRACGHLSRLSEITHQGEYIKRLLTHPPAGCSLTEQDDALSIRVSLRSAGRVVVSFLAALLLDLLLAISIALHLMTPPSTVTAASDSFKLLGIGQVCLLLTPFVIFILAVNLNLLFVLWGHTDVLVRGSRGTVQTGVRWLHWTRHFDASTVQQISTGWSCSRPPRQLLRIITYDKTVSLGSMLNDERRTWLRAVLMDRLILTKRA